MQTLESGLDWMIAGYNFFFCLEGDLGKQACLGDIGGYLDLLIELFVAYTLEFEGF